MDSDTKEFINENYTYAIVGATPNREKYGNIVLRDLKGAGYHVVGVNPKHTTVEGVPCYPRLLDIPEKPDVAVVIVPAEIGLIILDDAKKAGISKLIFQPGAESREIQKKAKSLGLAASTDGSCIMVLRHAKVHKT